MVSTLRFAPLLLIPRVTSPDWDKQSFVDTPLPALAVARSLFYTPRRASSTRSSNPLAPARSPCDSSVSARFVMLKSVSG